VAMVGFVPCRNKHRAKAASWQCFAYNLTLTRDVRSASVLHLMLVGRAVPCTPRDVGDRRRARSAASYLRYIASGQHRRASAISSASPPVIDVAIHCYIDEVGSKRMAVAP